MHERLWEIPYSYIGRLTSAATFTDSPIQLLLVTLCISSCILSDHLEILVLVFGEHLSDCHQFPYSRLSLGQPLQLR